MSYQSDAAKTPDDNWRVRSALKPKEKFTLEDFPIGRRVVCEMRVGYNSGLAAFALCEIVDACEAPKFADYQDDGLRLFGRILAVDNEKLSGLNGHLSTLTLCPRGSFHSRNSLRVTTIAPKTAFASVDTRPKGGDAPQSAAPFTGSAVPQGDATPTPRTGDQSNG